MKLFSLDRMTRRCGTEVSNSFFRERLVGASGRSLRAFIALAGLSLALATAPLHAAGGSPGKGDGKCKDNCPAEVQGIVEVLNDVLNQPFGVRSSSNSLSARFDIPDGKRLVIETVSFRLLANNSVGSTPFVVLRVFNSGTGLEAVLPGQFVGITGTTSIYIGTVPLKARLDSVPGSDSEFVVSLVGGTGFLDATVFGYLVDL